MNRITLVAVLLALSSVASAKPAGDISATDWNNARPKVELRVSRGTTSDTYAVEATISDLRSGKVLAHPKVITRAGVPAKIQAGAKGAAGLISVEATVTVAPSGATATYASEIKDNDAVVSSQGATLAVSS
ncbi:MULTISPECIES: hypothetical protein [Dyella]|uniref:Uncharacterized protein n=2 Tax=Dyella TaxID=231454 RepID=A0A4R0YU73_9GAMM|nr:MULTISPECIES: hypothetical protein [Dyella]TBR40416.1 hypothetical protein EYV96_09740 [Dyella terrae]TCI12001.1 hypothetical protein EZM97_01130 [Dyella soli]